jgi:hypothetical protein
VLGRLRVAADLVVVDCPISDGALRRDGVAQLLQALDVLVVAVTADRASVAAARRLFDGLPRAVERGWVPPALRLRIAVTGDEGSNLLDAREVAESFDVPGTIVPQWWGRTAPNFGFGPTLDIPEIEVGLASLLGVEPPVHARTPSYRHV